METSEALMLYGSARATYLEYLKKQIIVNDRVDLLATEVLGYEIQPFHLDMLQFQAAHPDNLQLVGRGYGKSTVCTVTKAIWYLCKYPKARIIIASKTVKQSQARLKEIAAHFESNELLIELFGQFYNKNLWNAREIEIAQRFDPKFKDSPGAASFDSTPSIACCGAKGSIAGAHFDIEFSDDLIDKTNSHSELTREEVAEWYSNTFTPMLDPPDPDIPFRMHRHRVGTRYHYLDQYGAWIKQAREAWKNGVPDDERMWINVIPAYDYKNTSEDPLAGLGLGVYQGRGTGKSPWPQRWNVKELLKRKRQIGRLAFEAQYLNDIDAMSGEIFDYEDFVEVPKAEVEALYEQMDFWIGADLAISEKNTADDSAFVVVGRLGRKKSEAKYFIVDVVAGKFRFSDQTRHIKRLHDKWNTKGAGVKQIGIEAVAYQAAQFQRLQEKYPDIKEKVKKVIPRKGTDKVSRAWNRTTLMESRRVHLMYEDKKLNGEMVRTTVGWRLREQMVLFPNGDHDDLFDAFDHAITRAEKRNRSGRQDRRKEEVGLF